MYLPTYNLWQLRLADKNPRQLTFGEVSYLDPHVNASGTVVASRMRIQLNIWKIPVGGSGVGNVRRAVQITKQTGQVHTPSLGPGDREIVYLSDSGGHANVWVARSDGSDSRQITFERDPAVGVAVPIWSPNGKSIAFVSSKNEPLGGWGLWLVNPDGSNLRHLPKTGGGACWGRDSRWIYYTRLVEGVYHVEKIPVEGGQSLTVRSDNASSPAVDSGGSALYYVAVGASDCEIRVARPENGPSALLAHIAGALVSPEERLNLQPYLSPDGKWLAVLLRDGLSTNIWAIPTSGGPMRRLTDFGSRRVFISRRVAWSSDSKSVYAPVGDADADVVLLDGLLP